MHDEKLNSTYILAVSSVIFVSIIFNLFIRKEYDFSFLMIDLDDVRTLVTLKNSEVVQYVLFNRIKQLIIVLILYKAFSVEKVTNFFVLVFSGALGLIISCQMYYLGLIGLIILMVYLLPYGFLYIYGFYYSNKEKLFCVGKDNVKTLFTFCVIFLTGVLFECFFMTIFLKNFYQYMVT